MPLGRPDPETGEIVGASRHYRGQHGLGNPAAMWTCPACGVENQGRRPEQGCAHCGSGDPSKVPLKEKWAQPPDMAREPEAVEPRTSDRERTQRPTTASAGGPRSTSAAETLTRVIRIIEYLAPPRAIDQLSVTLQRSLIGTLQLGDVQITATIVDTLDSQQEDRLGLAKRQPGVWLGTGSPELQAQQGIHVAATLQSPSPILSLPLHKGPMMPEPPSPSHVPPAPPVPAVGVSFSFEQGELAFAILKLVGPRVAHTIAMALGQIATELEGDAELDKFMSAQEAVQLAQALMECLPPGFAEPEAPPPPLVGPRVAQATVSADERIARIQENLREASRPKPIFKEPPQEDVAKER